MSLPGLDLSEAVAESSYAPPPPAEVNLRPGSEWRFEIAFGATVRVKVGLSSDLLCICSSLFSECLCSSVREYDFGA